MNKFIIDDREQPHVKRIANGTASMDRIVRNARKRKFPRGDFDDSVS